MTSNFTIGSLFAGIGGFDLAGRWVGWDTKWYSEIEPYACRVMAKQFPEAVNHGDITKIRGADVAPVDVLCGGFPCQDISYAGKGAGLDGERSGLWFEYARLIGELRPRWVVAENVAALRTRGLDRVLADLSALGYDAEWHCIPASAVGAPHRRDRIWIVARPAGLFPEPICTPESLLAYADGGAHVEGIASAVQREVPRGLGKGGNIPGWAVEPDVGRVAHGVPNRVDRLRCLGNAVVPQVPFYLFQQIEAAEARLAAIVEGLVA